MKKAERLIRITVIVYLALNLINIFLPDGLSVRLYPEQFLYQDIGSRLFAILRWFNDLALVTLPIAIFYKKRVFQQIVGFILFPTWIISVLCIPKYLQMYTNGLGAGIMSLRFLDEQTKAFFVNPTFRSLFLALLLLTEGLLIASVVVASKLDLKITDRENVKNFFLVFAGCLLSIMPIYVPSYIFGGYALDEDGWFRTFNLGSLQHILWMALIVLEIIILYHIFKKLDQQDRYIAMVIMSLGVFFQFLGVFTCFGEISASRFPIQLCNISSLLVLPAILSKNKTLSVFTLSATIVGALFAVIICDASTCGWTYIMNVHYSVEHSQIIAIPILCYLLNIYKDVETKPCKNIIRGFSIYYGVAFILGGIFTGLRAITDSDYWDCNYLFMFKKDFAAGILPAFGVLFDIHITLFNFFTITLFQLLVYIVFLLLCIGYYRLFCKIAQHWRKQTPIE